MPTESTPSEAGDLRDVWSSAARRASDTQLAACVALAIVAALAFGVGLLISVRRTLPWWPLVLPALLAGTFGVWGIADRELSDSTRRSSQRALAVTKVCSTVAAGVVAALAAMGFLLLTIGTWIS